jgi:Animal haem peroxidase
MTQDPARLQALATAYANNISKVDAWVGMLSEDHVAGASVGELLGTVLKDQFTRLRDGDPLFYKIDLDLRDPTIMTKVLNIDTVSLQEIIVRNTNIDHNRTKSAFVKGLGPFADPPKWPLNMSTVRSYNGTDRSDQLGAAHTPLLRLSNRTMMTYTGEGEMVVGVNPRSISNAIFAQTEDIFNDRGLLNMARGSPG